MRNDGQRLLGCRKCAISSAHLLGTTMTGRDGEGSVTEVGGDAQFLRGVRSCPTDKSTQMHSFPFRTNMHFPAKAGGHQATSRPKA